jgi:hypothetical protein
MAWWSTQFIFQGDTLIAEGLEPLFLQEVEWIVQEQPDQAASGAEPYTRIIVSGYALYGKLQGYYALGVSHWYLDRTANRLLLSETSQRNSEPVASLSKAQQAIIRECLVRLNPEAWETSNISFRKQLGA